MIQLYHLTRRTRVYEGEVDAFVIATESEQAARKIAALICGEEGPHTWLMKSVSRCKIVKRIPKGACFFLYAQGKIES